MNLLNMTNRIQIHEFFKKVKQRKVLSLKPHYWNSVIYYEDGNWQQRQNFSSISPTLHQQAPKKHRNMGCKY